MSDPNNNSGVFSQPCPYHAGVEAKLDKVAGDMGEVKDGIKEINKRLFIDNGHKSIQTQLRELGEWKDRRIKELDAEKTGDKIEVNPNKIIAFCLKHWGLILIFIFLLFNRVSPNPKLLGEIEQARQQVQKLVNDVNTLETIKGLK